MFSTPRFPRKLTRSPVLPSLWGQRRYRWTANTFFSTCPFLVHRVHVFPRWLTEESRESQDLHIHGLRTGERPWCADVALRFPAGSLLRNAKSLSGIWITQLIERCLLQLRTSQLYPSLISILGESCSPRTKWTCCSLWDQKGEPLCKGMGGRSTFLCGWRKVTA